MSDDKLKEILEKVWIEEIGSLEIKPDVKPSHGNCCTCQDCGYGHDECNCTVRWVVKEIDQAISEINKHMVSREEYELEKARANHHAKQAAICEKLQEEIKCWETDSELTAGLKLNEQTTVIKLLQAELKALKEEHRNVVSVEQIFTLMQFAEMYSALDHNKWTDLAQAIYQLINGGK